MSSLVIATINKEKTNFKVKKKKEKRSPKTFLKECIFDQPPVKKNKKKKVSMDEFEVLSYEQYDELVERNYNVSQLKSMCRFYKQKVSGNKRELIFLLYNYLKYSHFAAKIQSLFRGHLLRYMERLRGPGLNEQCVNETDFFTLDEISNIPYNQLFSYRDKDNFIYAFDIMSFYNLIKKSEKTPLNPYNRNKIYKDILLKFNRHIALSRVLQIPITIKIDKYKNMNEEKKYEMEVIELFQDIDNLGNYTDSAWFTSLDRRGYIRFFRILRDIWIFRGQIPTHIKIKIAPLWDPFLMQTSYDINDYSIEDLQNLCLSVIEDMVYTGVDVEYKTLGALHVLSVLTIVNYSAREAMPWLYESLI